MTEPPTPELARERDELIAEIHAAFAGVSREGGVSWSETRVLDDELRPTTRKRLAARALDREPRWEALVDDPAWSTEEGFGQAAFSFLDPIGFRYYLGLAMLRCLRRGYDVGIELHLTIHREYDPMAGLAPAPSERWREYYLRKWSALDERQRRCVARFLRFMLSLAETGTDEHGPDEWGAEGARDALDSYWGVYAGAGANPSVPLDGAAPE